ncbi:MAG: diacylglycerol/lipid kinase family protein [Allosphingosinicella sp.]
MSEGKLKKIRVVINRGGGSFGEDKAGQLKPLFEARGIDAKILAVEPGDLDRHCGEAAKAAGVDALVAAGGDGTIGTAAAAVADTGMKLGILPLGTLNHFARDAGIPLDLEAAVDAIAAGRTRRVDVAEVNGRVFINNSAVGLYPRLVRDREKQQRHLGRSKKAAMIVAAARSLWRFSHHRLTLRIEGREAPVETPLLFVGNNRYETGLLALGRREAIDRGELCIYAPLARSAWSFLWISTRAVFGRPDEQEDFLTLDGIEAAEIGSPRQRLMVATDGEAQPMEAPLKYRIRAGALNLIVPEAKDEERGSSSRT